MSSIDLATGFKIGMYLLNREKTVEKSYEVLMVELGVFFKFDLAVFLLNIGLKLMWAKRGKKEDI